MLDELHEELINWPNKKGILGNGIFDRYIYPVLTAAHVPISWRYDFKAKTNLFLIERISNKAGLIQVLFSFRINTS